MDLHQFVDVGITGGSMLIVLCASSLIRLIFRPGKRLEES